MKRVGSLYPHIGGWDILREAFRRARKGARQAGAAAAFERDLDRNLRTLGQELNHGEVRLLGFHRFQIHDPKERTIDAPAFRDRVLHHAILLVCEPYFERWLVHDTYACRRGKGQLALTLSL